MKDNNILQYKSLDFAVRIYKLAKVLAEERNEKILADQILRSGTSIGANVAEAKRAESNSDFIHKLAISSKEGEETIFWLRLLQKVGIISDREFNSMFNDCNELMKLLSSISLSMKRQRHNS